jgi:hypothetical protein
MAMDLAVGLLEEGAKVRAPLAADADDAHVHLVARGHEAGAAQDVAGKDRRGGNRGGRRGQNWRRLCSPICFRLMVFLSRSEGARPEAKPTHSRARA